MSCHRRIAAVAACFTVAAATAAHAADFKLPDTIAWTSYNVGTSTYNQAVAIGSALKNEAGVNLRIVPGKNDISRQLPVREGKIPFASTGLGALYSQEAMFEFSAPGWGPQKVRMIAMCNSDAHAAVITAKDAGIREYSDLKGKRVAWVRSAPSLNGTTTAMLAFGGLDWSDVEKVEVPGFVASMRAILNNQADAATVISTSGFSSQIAASPRGAYWPPLPHSDEAAWQRLWKVAPWLQKARDPIGAAIPEQGFDGVGLSYPYIITYDTTDDELVYNMTKAIHALYDTYKDGAPGAKGYALDRQRFEYLMPWHQAAIRYYKEAGVWTDELQAHNDKLIERQNVLIGAWKELRARDIEDDAFKAAWMEQRAAALEKAGFEPIWR